MLKSSRVEKFIRPYSTEHIGASRECSRINHGWFNWKCKIGKWGFVGSTHHTEYKQKSLNNDLVDKSLFVTSYVPLQLISKSDHTIIWKNARPSSTHYCRPVRFKFFSAQGLTSSLMIWCDRTCACVNRRAFGGSCRVKPKDIKEL